MTDADTLDGKVMIDVSNPLTRSAGVTMLSVANTTSTAEQIQRAYPSLRVVKSLNTVTAAIMVQPSLLPGEHVMFVGGNDAAAKEQVVDLLDDFGWKRDSVLDLGDISAARAMEMYVVMWVRMYGVLGTPNFNIAVVH
jgi:predicted dinucleotide-binding enzyme